MPERNCSAKACEQVSLAKRLHEAIQKLDSAQALEAGAMAQFDRMCEVEIWHWPSQSVAQLVGPDAVAAFKAAIKANCAAAIAEAQRQLEAVV